MVCHSAVKRRNLLLAIAVACSFLAAQAQTKLHISPTRHASDDLELTGLIANLPPGAVAYVSYAALATLPQITTAIQGDSNFAGLDNIRVTGIPLDQLARAL